jgi:acetyltransferase-like isoleucine patch superfamily enzyme
MTAKRAAEGGSALIKRGALDVAPDLEAGIGCVVGGRHARTVVGRGCILGDYVKLGGGVHLGDRSRAGDYALLGHPTKAEVSGFDPSRFSPRIQDVLIEAATTDIGEGAVIRSHSIIYLHVRIGPGLVTGHHALIREHTTIGARCVFGTHASCDGYAFIGDDVHVGQYAQLSQAARIGDGVFVGGHTVFSDNPLAIRSVEEDLFGALVEDYVRIGLGCVILPSVRIGHDAVVGAGSVVTKDVPASVLAYGNPCRVARDLRPDEIQAYRTSVGRHAQPEDSEGAESS